MSVQVTPCAFLLNRWLSFAETKMQRVGGGRPRRGRPANMEVNNAGLNYYFPFHKCFKQRKTDSPHFSGPQGYTQETGNVNTTLFGSKSYKAPLCISYLHVASSTDRVWTNRTDQYLLCCFKRFLTFSVIRLIPSGLNCHHTKHSWTPPASKHWDARAHIFFVLYASLDFAELRQHN